MERAFPRPRDEADIFVASLWINLFAFFLADIALARPVAAIPDFVFCHLRSVMRFPLAIGYSRVARYSRSALIGLIRTARRAGSKQARTAAKPRIRAAEPNTMGS